VIAANQLIHETGARYIDFVVPGLLGMNLMGSACGAGLRYRRCAAQKTAQAPGRIAHAKWQYLASFLLSRLVMLVIEVVLFLTFARFAFGVPSADRCSNSGSFACLLPRVFRARPARLVARQNN